MGLIEEYRKERKKAFQRRRYYQNKYGIEIYKIPKIPKKITSGSIRRLAKLNSKIPTVREINKKIGLTPTGKIKKSDKNKDSKKKTIKRTKQESKYLPQEKDRIIENVSSMFYSLDDIDNVISDMSISSRRGNNTHRANVYDLSRMLRAEFDKALFDDGEAIVTKRLADNANIVEEAIQAIEGYYKDSSEEQLKEAIDSISELISIISGKTITQNSAKDLEDLYSGTMEFYQIDDTAHIIVETGTVYKRPDRHLINKDTGEDIELISRPARFVINQETGEVIEAIVI